MVTKGTMFTRRRGLGVGLQSHMGKLRCAGPELHHRLLRAAQGGQTVERKYLASDMGRAAHLDRTLLHLVPLVSRVHV